MTKKATISFDDKTGEIAVEVNSAPTPATFKCAQCKHDVPVCYLAPVKGKRLCAMCAPILCTVCNENEITPQCALDGVTVCEECEDFPNPSRIEYVVKDGELIALWVGNNVSAGAFFKLDAGMDADEPAARLLAVSQLRKNIETATVLSRGAIANESAALVSAIEAEQAEPNTTDSFDDSETTRYVNCMGCGAAISDDDGCAPLLDGFLCVNCHKDWVTDVPDFYLYTCSECQEKKSSRISPPVYPISGGVHCQSCTNGLDTDEPNTPTPNNSEAVKNALALQQPSIPLIFANGVMTNISATLAERMEQNEYGVVVDKMTEAINWWNGVNIALELYGGVLPAGINEQMPERLVQAILTLHEAIDSALIDYVREHVGMVAGELTNMLEDWNGYDCQLSSQLMDVVSWFNGIIEQFEQTEQFPNEGVEAGLFDVIAALWAAGAVN